MTWFSENSTVPSFLLASSTIQYHFVNRFHGPFPCCLVVVLSARRLPSLLRVPPSMVPRSRKYYEGATTSHWRIDDRLFFFASVVHVILLSFVSAVALLEGLQAPSRPGHLAVGRPQCRRLHVDANGISQVSR